MHVQLQMHTCKVIVVEMAVWTDEETVKLIDLWGEEDVQAELESCKRNKHVYERISQGMMAANYERNTVQCREKIKKLRAEYKKVKDSNNISGKGRKTMKFYEKLNEILGHKPATRPAIVVDTSAITETEEENSTVLDSSGGPEDCNDGSSTPMHSSSDAKETSPEDVEKEETQAEVKSERKRKKKRPAREEMFEKAMETAMKKVAQMNEESEKRFMELEEKRLKLDEHMMEMEERRRKEDLEREDQQRREEREFQLRVYVHIIMHYTQTSCSTSCGALYILYIFVLTGNASLVRPRSILLAPTILQPKLQDRTWKHV